MNKKTDKINEGEMKYLKVFLLFVLLSSLFVVSCSDDNSTEPEPQIIIPEISVTIDAYPNFTVAGTGIRFYIDEISDTVETERINLKFDHDGDGIFDEGIKDSVYWVYKIDEMGKYDVDVILEYDNQPFDTTQVEIFMASPPTECYAQGATFSVHEISWSQDSKKILFPGTGHNPWIFDIDTWDIVKLFEGDEVTCRHSPIMSPDQRYVAYDARNGQGIEYIDLQTNEWDTLVYVENGQPYGIDWSPDGEHIVFAGSGHPRPVFVTSFPDGDLRHLQQNGDAVGWSPDASKILIASVSSAAGTGYTETIQIVNFATGETLETIEHSYDVSPNAWPYKITWVKNRSWVYSSLSRTFYNIETDEKFQINLPWDLKQDGTINRLSVETCLSPNGQYMAFGFKPPGSERFIVHYSMLPQEIYE